MPGHDSPVGRVSRGVPSCSRAAASATAPADRRVCPPPAPTARTPRASVVSPEAFPLSPRTPRTRSHCPRTLWLGQFTPGCLLGAKDLPPMRCRRRGGHPHPPAARRRRGKEPLAETWAMAAAPRPIGGVEAARGGRSRCETTQELAEMGTGTGTGMEMEMGESRWYRPHEPPRSDAGGTSRRDGVWLVPGGHRQGWELVGGTAPRGFLGSPESLLPSEGHVEEGQRSGWPRWAPWDGEGCGGASSLSAQPPPATHTDPPSLAPVGPGEVAEPSPRGPGTPRGAGRKRMRVSTYLVRAPRPREPPRAGRAPPSRSAAVGQPHGSRGSGGSRPLAAWLSGVGTWLGGDPARHPSPSAPGLWWRAAGSQLSARRSAPWGGGARWGGSILRAHDGVTGATGGTWRSPPQVTPRARGAWILVCHHVMGLGRRR